MNRILDIRVGDCTGVGLVYCHLEVRLRALAGVRWAWSWALRCFDDSLLGAHRSAAILTNPYITQLHMNM